MKNLDVCNIDEELSGISNEIENRKQSRESQHMGVYYIRQRTTDRVIEPFYCYLPLGGQVDAFLELLDNFQREAIKKFVERERREPREEYLWIREEISSKVNIFKI